MIKILVLHSEDTVLYYFDIHQSGEFKTKLSYLVNKDFEVIRPYPLRQLEEMTESEFHKTLKFMFSRHPNALYEGSRIPFNKIDFFFPEINSMTKISKKCIENFIKNNGFEIIERIIEQDLDGSIVKIELENRNKKIAEIRYNVDLESKSLHIGSVKSKIKNIENFKFFKVVLLMLLSDYLSQVDTFTLMASPSGKLDKRGTEFCLLCYYEQLGFEIMDKDKKRINKFIEKCKKSISPDNLTDSCLLCKCQKLEIDIGEQFDIAMYSADMKAVAANIKDILLNYYNEIC